MILPLMPRQVYVPKAGTLTKPAEDKDKIFFGNAKKLL